jgi:hypothetical protein
MKRRPREGPGKTAPGTLVVAGLISEITSPGAAIAGGAQGGFVLHPRVTA